MQKSAELQSKRIRIILGLRLSALPFYTLGFPNNEVEVGFLKSFFPIYTGNAGVEDRKLKNYRIRTQAVPAIAGL